MESESAVERKVTKTRSALRAATLEIPDGSQLLQQTATAGSDICKAKGRTSHPAMG